LLNLKVKSCKILDIVPQEKVMKLEEQGLRKNQIGWLFENMLIHSKALSKKVCCSLDTCSLDEDNGDFVETYLFDDLALRK
jgi:hypothetical protein